MSCNVAKHYAQSASPLQFAKDFLAFIKKYEEDRVQLKSQLDRVREDLESQIKALRARDFKGSDPNFWGNPDNNFTLNLQGVFYSCRGLLNALYNLEDRVSEIDTKVRELIETDPSQGKLDL